MLFNDSAWDYPLSTYQLQIRRIEPSVDRVRVDRRGESESSLSATTDDDDVVTVVNGRSPSGCRHGWFETTCECLGTKYLVCQKCRVVLCKKDECPKRKSKGRENECTQAQNSLPLETKGEVSQMPGEEHRAPSGSRTLTPLGRTLGGSLNCDKPSGLEFVRNSSSELHKQKEFSRPRAQASVKTPGSPTSSEDSRRLAALPRGLPPPRGSRKGKRKKEQKFSGVFGPSSKPSFQEVCVLAKNEELAHQGNSPAEKFNLPSITEEKKSRTMDPQNEELRLELEIQSKVELKETNLFPNYVAGLGYSSGFDGISICTPGQLPSGILITVKVVEIMLPLTFFLQTRQEFDNVESWKSELRSMLNPLNPDQIKEGVYVIALKSSGDAFRAQVEEVDVVKNMCRVRYVDTGFVEIVGMKCLFRLPDRFAKFRRQVTSFNVIDIIPIGNDELVKLTTSLLKGSQVMLNISHECAYVQNNFYGMMRMADGTDVSLTLREAGFVKQLDFQQRVAGGYLKPFLHPVELFQAPKLNFQEQVEGRIVAVTSPSDFSICTPDSRVELAALVRSLRILVETGQPPSFHVGLYSGARYCILPSPYAENEYCRGFCEEVNYNVAPGMAKIYLVDFGAIDWFPMTDLKEYILSITANPPLAYRCGIAAQPAGGEWSPVAIQGSKGIMSRSATTRIRFTCQGWDDDVNLTTVKSLTSGEDSWDWITALKNIGEIVNHDDSQQTSSEIRTPLFCDEYENFTEQSPYQGPDRLDYIKLKERASKYSLSNLPTPQPLEEGCILKTQRLSGCYLYLVMEKSCHEKYAELKKHSKQLAKSESSKPGDYEFNEGDVVLAQWNAAIYQRCYIISFTEKGGVRYAKLKAIDIEKCVESRVSDLRLVDDYLMQVSKLSHVVWLEGTDPSTYVHLKQLDEVIGSHERWTILTKTKIVRGCNQVARLAFQGNSELKFLEGVINEMRLWNWERLFNVGFNSTAEIVEVLGFAEPELRKFEVKKFMMSGKEYLSEIGKEACPVMLREGKLDESQARVVLQGVLRNETVMHDYSVLQEQLEKYYSKLKGEKPILDVTDPPKVLAWRETNGNFNNVDTTAHCRWHRSVYSAATGKYKCVDCFKASVFKAPNIEFRDICSELLTLPPLGIRMYTNLELKNPYMKAIASETLLKPGTTVKITVEKTEVAWNAENETLDPVSVKVLEVEEMRKAKLEELRRVAADKENSTAV